MLIITIIAIITDHDNHDSVQYLDSIIIYSMD